MQHGRRKITMDRTYHSHRKTEEYKEHGVQLSIVTRERGVPCDSVVPGHGRSGMKMAARLASQTLPILELSERVDL